MAESGAFSTRQRVLHEGETELSLNNWIESLLFHISNEPKFSRFLEDLDTWGAATENNRGFIADVVEVNGKKMTAQNKAINLKVLLGYIAIHSPVVSASFIKEEARSLNDIFKHLKEHFECAQTGSQITELMSFSLKSGETKEALWERIYHFFVGNLLTTASGILHQGRRVINDEAITPTLLNIAVVVWLDAIHEDLPLLVKQRFAIPLRANTIFSIRSEISAAIPSLLADIHNGREGVISYTPSEEVYYGREGNIMYTPSRRSRIGNNFPQNRRSKRESYPSKNYPKMARCCLCEAAKRPGSNTHYIQNCPFLPPEDRKYITRVGDVEVQSDSEFEGDFVEHFHRSSIRHTLNKSPPEIARIDIISSPSIDVQIKGVATDIILDTGAESNLIREDEARRLGLEVFPTSHRANMADGRSPMVVSGEVHFQASRACPSSGNSHYLKFDGLVVKDLNCSLLGGMPFLDKNDVYLRPKINSVFLGDCCNFRYTGIRRCSNVRAATILRVPRQECILPGAALTLPIPSEFHNDIVSLEPRNDSESHWIKCHFVKPENGMISIENQSNEPILVKRHMQLCQVRSTSLAPPCHPLEPAPVFSPISSKAHSVQPISVSVDPSGMVLSPADKALISNTNERFSDVFSSTIGCYNGHSGPFTHKINMSDSLPPQRRGRIPLYTRNNLELLQMKFDELYHQGVFKKPEDLSLTAEYVSPSFLVAKSAGGHRLVTAFAELGQFAKPQPSIMPSVDDIIRHLARFKFLIKADLSQAYYQIPLDRASLKYVGVCTPFKGVYVYTRAVMGLPGSESALEQLLCKVLGDLMVEGSVIKLADDLYVGGDTPQALNAAWEKVLHLLSINNLRLSPSKTVCCPLETNILGWLWKQGTLSATPHRLNALAVCDRPKTIKALRSFIGSYKFLSKVLPRHSDVLGELEKVCAGADSKTLIMWTESLSNTFEKAKAHLKEAKILTLPRPEDKLQIVTDASTSTSGLASTLIVIRDGKPLLGGLFNAKKSSSQSGWLACELEALGIAAGIKFFGPYLVQSDHQTEVLTDSKPCVQAYSKFLKGSFSSSPRLVTFLSTLSRYHVKLSHISGPNNVLSDYISRNSLQCQNKNCQVCNFIAEIECSVIGNLSVTDILSGKCPVPFTTRSTWLQIQRNCSTLMQVYTLLRDGRVPSKKQKGATDVRRYLNHCKLSSAPSDGLIVVNQEVPLQSARQKIVIPRNIIDGLLTALHLQLRHASKHQLKQIFTRAFFALDLDSALTRVVDGCHSCASLRKVPSQFKEQSTSKPPDRLGAQFAGDIIQREGQSILLLREDISSLTDGVIIQNETTEEVKGGLIQMLSRFRPLLSFKALIRLDGQPCFQSLSNNCLKELNVEIEIGQAKNINRNPIAERAVQDFHEELCKLKPEGGRFQLQSLP